MELTAGYSVTRIFSSLSDIAKYLLSGERLILVKVDFDPVKYVARDGVTGVAGENTNGIRRTSPCLSKHMILSFV